MSRFSYMRVLYTLLLSLCVVFAVVLATKTWQNKRVDKWKTFDSVFFSVRYPSSWRTEVKHGNTLYIRPPEPRRGGVMVAVWSAPTEQDKKDVVRWAREEALSLSVDGRYSSVRINIDKKQRDGIKFKVKSGSLFLDCLHLDLTLSKHVLVIGITSSNEKDFYLMNQIIQSIKIKDRVQNDAK